MNFLRVFLLFSVLFVLSSPDLEAAPKKMIRSALISGQKYVSLKDAADYYGMKVMTKGNDVILYSRYYKAEFNLKKRAGSFNGTKLSWFFVPVKRGNDYYLSEKDFLIILDPLLRKKSLPRRPVRSVMIDAGHGGKDTGAIGVNKKREKDITLSIVLKLRRKLIKLGYSVRLTRSRDVFPSLERRVTLWGNARPRPDLFISIHCNAAGNKNVSGIETFATTPSGAPSTADVKPEMKRYDGNKFDKYNTRLAYDIQRSLKKAIPTAADRGVKHARFYVIRNVSCPAVLIETGFLSNKAECNELSSDSYQERIASGILSGILTYSARVR